MPSLAVLLAYPLLMVAFYVIYRVGRRAKRRDARFEWIRLCMLAILFGVVAAFQVRMMTNGHAGGLAASISGALSLGCISGLLALHVADFAQLKSRRRAQPTL